MLTWPDTNTMLKALQAGPASREEQGAWPSSTPVPRVPQLEARAASMERQATVAEAENSSLQQQLKSLQGIYLTISGL